MNSANPWACLTTPQSANDVSILRVDEDHRWPIYWGVSQQHRLLIIRLKGQVSFTGKLPKFKGLEISIVDTGQGPSRSLILTLLDDQANDMFALFCRDIIDATRSTPTEPELVQEIVTRTWMWHRFLQKGKSGLLTAEEQRGLIGELSVLKDVCIAALGADQAVNGWTGPVGTARDFEYGSTCLEIKAKRAPALPFVEINSEFQLDPSELDVLFLLIVDVTAATGSSGWSLNTIVNQLRDSLAADGDVLDVLNERLTAAGYLSSDDYSEWRWSAGDIQGFMVSESFPSLRHSQVPSAVSSVTYKLSLQQCKPHEIERSEIEACLRRTRNDG